MKPTALALCVLLGTATAAEAQLSLLPQLGFEQSKTSVMPGNGAAFLPRGISGNFKANLRADYRFKKGHSPYVSIGTAPGAVTYSFNDLSTLATNFNATNNPLQLKLEGGYQFSSQPIRLKKGSKQTTAPTPKPQTRPYGCRSSYYHHREMPAAVKPKEDKSFAFRLQPSVGMAYLPAAEKNAISTNNNEYQYQAGDYKTSIVSGMGIEFDKGKQRLATLMVFYTKGLGNLKTEQIVTGGNKADNVFLNSKRSTWGMTLGIPLSLTKIKKPAVAPQPAKQYPTRHEYRGGCRSYSGRCTRSI
jgi:opacity protein-like surface antigen